MRCCEQGRTRLQPMLCIQILYSKTGKLGLILFKILHSKMYLYISLAFFNKAKIQINSIKLKEDYHRIDKKSVHLKTFKERVVS